MTRKALVVLSGGQDSTTCLFWAKEQFDEVHAVTFNYEQRHTLEVDAARRVAHIAGVPHEVVYVGSVLKSTSPLTDKSSALETYESFETMDAVIGNRVELTFVPMRNVLFLTLAANRAIALGCSNIVTGVCAMDNANYPDCRIGFVQSMQRTINEALGIDYFRILTPLLMLTKAESIQLATKLPGCMEAMAFSHTCYAGEYPPCGKCHACVLRAEGFKQAGIADPLVERGAKESAVA
jgi:7-cyano-7-deazaguanine synthase